MTAAPRPGPEDCKILPDRSLRGRTALVTGAGSGIGRAITLRLLELGASVFGVGRREERLAETSALDGTGRFRYEALDIRDRDAAADLVAGLGGVDLLVNNAGGQFVAPVHAMSRRGFDAVVALNLTATASLIRAARPGLAARGGRVVNLSISAPDRGFAGLAHTAAARSGMAELTRSLAADWRTDGVRLFCLAPGTVLTTGAGGELLAGALAGIVEKVPLGRDTTVAEVAEWAVALGAGTADATTGALIELDGGAGLTGLGPFDGGPPGPDDGAGPDEATGSCRGTDQVVIAIDGTGGLDAAASGDVAVRLGDAFGAARDALPRLAPGGAVLLRCTVPDKAPALAGAITSLCRSLAREAAPQGVRVNAIIAPPSADVTGLAALLGHPASTMCTGAVLDAR